MKIERERKRRYGNETFYEVQVVNLADVIGEDLLPLDADTEDPQYVRNIAEAFGKLAETLVDERTITLEQAGLLVGNTGYDEFEIHKEYDV